MSHAAKLVLLIFAASTPARAVTPPHTPERSRVVTFAGGQAVIDADGDGDHVVVKDAHETVTSESWCDAGRFDDYFTLFTKLKDAVARKDRLTVAKLVAFPFRVNTKKALTVRTRASFLKVYDKVFTPTVLRKIGAAEPAAVFCRNGAGMLGDGVIWADSSGATVLNP